MNVKTWYALALAASIFSIQVHAQNVGVNEDASPPNPNAILDIKSFNKGLLIPRMSTTGRMAIPNTKGLLVYDTTASAFFYNTGSAWKNLLTGNLPWSLVGNNNTDTTNFLGTIDSAALRIRVNNLLSGLIDLRSGNAFFGYNTDSVLNTDSAHNNTVMGGNSLTSNVSGSFNTAIGSFSLSDGKTTSNNTAIGTNTLIKNTKGGFNVAIGAGTLLSNTVGSFNTGNGIEALALNVSGNSNTGIGAGALIGNTSGSFNTANGVGVMAGNNSGSFNTANGQQALDSNTVGHDNTANGMTALRGNTTGNGNTAHGYNALFWNSTGSYNTAIGNVSMEFNRTGSFNTAIGSGSLENNVSGNYNTSLGGGLSVNISGNFNTGIGSTQPSASNLTNSTAIGNFTIVDASNKVRIGNSSVTVIEGQVPFTTPSDGRFKYELKEDVRGLDFILQLRPVTYLFDTKKMEQQMRQHSGVSFAKQSADAGVISSRRSGFIAQEVEKAAIRTGYHFSGVVRPSTAQSYYSLSYESFVIPLVKAMQEQHQILAAQEQQIATLEKIIRSKEEQYKKVAALQADIAELNQLIGTLKKDHEKK